MADHATKTPNARLPIEALLDPFVSFAKIEAAGGILLMASTIAALVWANSAWAESYYALWNAPNQVLSGHVSRTVAERCQRFSNLCSRPAMNLQASR